MEITNIALLLVQFPFFFMHFEFQNFREFGWYQYVITLEDAVTLKQNEKKMRFTARNGALLG